METENETLTVEFKVSLQQILDVVRGQGDFGEIWGFLEEFWGILGRGWWWRLVGG